LVSGKKKNMMGTQQAFKTAKMMYVLQPMVSMEIGVIWAIMS
jgi:hypothetical protein